MKVVFSLILVNLLINLIGWTQIPAFPGAEGFGAQTIGGRGGDVIKVTNLNDRGPGSLRAALEAEGPRIVIFTTGGIIDLDNRLEIRNPFITIAGQTAPGDGICIRGAGIRIYTHDVVVRYLRVRPGDIDFGPPNRWASVDAITIANDPNDSQEAHSIIIDHCSLSWAVDEVLDIWYKAHDITIQHCTISEALHESKHPKGYHGMGMLTGPETARLSLHHNLFAHNNDRNPLVYTQDVVDFRNNVIYNPGGVAADFTGLGTQKVNFVNNYIIDGPSSHTDTDIILRVPKSKGPKFYIDSNISTKKITQGYLSDWSMVRDYYNAPIDEAVRASQEFAHPEVTTHDATAALTYVLKNVGASLPARDPVDKKLVKDVVNREGGQLNHKEHPLEWPPLYEGISPADSDDDGMPDHWEDEFGLDAAYDDANEDIDQDQYTNIEEYLNSTNPTQSTGIQPLSAPSARFAIPNQEVYPRRTFSIEQNYPNPIRGTTNLKFDIDEPSPVTLKVIDMYGKVVDELVNGFLYDGKYHVLWDAAHINTGIYYIALTSHNKVRSIKAIVSH